MIEINDNLTVAGNILTDVDGTPVIQEKIRAELDYVPFVNKDLVGEPLNPGIYDEFAEEDDTSGDDSSDDDEC